MLSDPSSLVKGLVPQYPFRVLVAWLRSKFMQAPSVMLKAVRKGLNTPSLTLVSFPDSTTHAHEERVWGHWSRFLVLVILQAQQSCDYLHRFVLEHVRSRDGAQDQENAPMSPDPFPRMRGGVWERD